MDPTLPEAETPPLPDLPPNVEVVRPPACFENGVVGWLLYTRVWVALSDYKWAPPPPPHGHPFEFLPPLLSPYSPHDLKISDFTSV